MEHLMPVLGLSVSFLSLLGVFLLFYSLLKVESAFLPLLTVSTVTILTYIGGLFGILSETVFVLYVAGFAALIYAIVLMLRKKLDPMPVLKSPATWMFALLCVYFVVRMRGMQSIHVDNFSHWATIIKEMCLTDAFPATGSAVTFRNYTPGSAVFIYYVCSAVGYTEGSALMAQGFILAAAVAAFFCKARVKAPITFMSLTAASAVCISIPELLSGSLHYYNFLVDGLIAYITVAAGIIVYYYRNDVKRCIAVLTPVISMLTIIKTSARFFALFITVLVFILFARKIFRKESFENRFAYKALAGIGALIAAQLLVPSLWNAYISNAFPEVALEDNKFPTTFGGLMSTFVSKDKEFLKGIVSDMTEKLTDLTDPVIMILLLSEIFAVCVILITLIMRKNPGVALVSFVAANLTFILYIGELFVLYGFIFPEWESEILAAFYRYLSTGVVIAVSILLLGGIYRISQIEGKLSRPVLSAAVLAVMLIFCVDVMGEQTVQIINPTHRPEVETRISERARYSGLYSKVASVVPRGSSVIVCSDDTSYFASVLPGFELCTASYSFVYPYDYDTPEYTKKRISGVDYVVVLDKADAFYDAAVNIMGIEIKNNTPSSVYRVDADGESFMLVPVS